MNIYKKDFIIAYFIAYSIAYSIDNKNYTSLLIYQKNQSTNHG